MQKTQINNIDHDDQIILFFNALFGENTLDAILNICLKTKDKGLITSSFESSDHDVITKTITQLREKGDVYFEVCLQNNFPEQGKRGKALDKKIMLGLWFDVDVAGKNHAASHYPKTKEEALSFVKDFNPSLVIDTGGGYHFYKLFKEPWILKSEADREKASFLIEKFQRHIISEGKKNGWHLDFTGDMARLMRIPGTFNYKRDKSTPVQIIHYDSDCRYSPDDFDFLFAQPEENIDVICAHQDGVLQNYPLAKICDIEKSCAWVEHCRVDAHMLKEPLWFAMLSIIGRCENATIIAHEWSSPYTEYSVTETDTKLLHALKAGPRTCKSIRHELDGESYCSHCPFWSHIKSPISLGDPTPSVQMKIKAAKLLAASFDDRGLPFAQESLQILVSLQKTDLATYSRIRAGLASLNISVTKLETEMKKFVMMSHDVEQESDIPYFVKNNSFYYIRQTPFGEDFIKLTNFCAEIAEEVTKDDGVKQEIFFKVKGTQSDGKQLPDANISAENFKGMGWVHAAYGSRGIINAGMGIQDHVRAAIQLMSKDVVRKVIYSHTGWRKIGDEWLYLNGSGAIGSKGIDQDISVSLDENLALFSMPGLLDGISVVEAITQSLKMIDLAPPIISYGLLSSIYRAPLGEIEPIDFSDYIHGFTGTLKSAVAAIVQAHFGPDFKGKSLPASWSSTANFLERLAFLVKDAVCVIDDFLPGGNIYEAAAMHSKADRVLRAQGNLNGRGRMASDTSLRRTYKPRGLILSTGEDVPKGQSLRARLYIMEAKPGDVDLSLLTILQQKAATGVLAGAMFAYLQWLAPKIDDLKKLFPIIKVELRDRAIQDVKSHLRMPEIVASKMLGIDTFLKFAVEMNAITESRATDIWQQAWGTFCAADATQAELLQADDPVIRFIDLLNTAFISGLAHLEDFAGGSPVQNPAAWGWEIGGSYNGQEILKPKGKKIGWISGHNIYLDPDASYMVVQEIASRSGSPITITPIVLRKRMDERGWIQKKDKKNLVKVIIIQNVKHKIIHILTTALHNSANSTSDISDEPGTTTSLVPEFPSDPLFPDVPMNFVFEEDNQVPDGKCDA